MAQAKVYHSAVWDTNYLWSNGGYVTARDLRVLLACAKAVGWGNLRLSQGGLSTFVLDSAATHAGLNVGDIAVDGRPRWKVWALCAALIISGIMPFPRGYAGRKDPWTGQKHIHWVSFPPTHAHWQAQNQVTEYRRSGGDGLIGSYGYTGPNAKLDTWANSPYNPTNIREGKLKLYVVSSTLLGLNVNRGKKTVRKRGYTIYGVKRVKRWGRWNLVTRFGTYYAIKDANGTYLSSTKP
jgi:hypothetical protein